MTGFRLFLALLTLFSATTIISCQSAFEEPDTAITLRVTSDSELDRLDIVFQNPEGDEQLVEFPLSTDLRDEAFVFSLRPGERFQDTVFIWVKGWRGQAIIAQASRVTQFVSGTIVEEAFELRSAFIDSDGDGFSPCSDGPSCDCDDTQATINPLAQEVCGDVVDNNCNGAAEEDCPCVEDQICTVVPDTFIDVSAGIGRCQFGIRRCNDGVLAETCEGALGIGEEEILGNYIDDDCDGSVDEGGVCTAGDSRPCLLGFVDDVENPDEEARQAASELALGVCQLGSQLCSPNGTWQSCEGEVRPQRDPETGIFIELTTQCDGLDNDCDGVIDDETYFDADGDGFTRCGTCRSGNSGELLCAESIDCNDSDPLISPDAIELCGNDVDENCRCDHDDSDRPIGPNSAINKPAYGLDGSRNCTEANTFLDCSRLPRSDPNPTGYCSELEQPYFAGFVEGADGQLGACMSCGLVFGLQCLEDGGCSDPSYDCRACNVVDDVFAPRPHCTQPDPLTCRNDTQPIFDPIFGSDPYDDCGDVGCEGYYFGIENQECYRRADVAALEVVCQGSEACEDAPTLCPASVKNETPEPMPLCTVVTAGCDGLEPPQFSDQVAGSDVFGACNDVYNCASGGDGTGPFYHGIFTENGLAYCFYKEVIENSACNGSGACQSKAQACLDAGRGEPVNSRPQCETPLSGCTDTVGPIYGPVEQFQDPYSDCAGPEGCCVDAFGAGVCCQAQGSTCSVDTECASGLSCVEGVCCDGSCDSPCESCVASLSTASDDGVCAPLAERSLDTAPLLLCGDGAGNCGGDAGCECVAGSGDCRRQIGSVCEQGNQCSTLACECADSTCDDIRCVPEECSQCRFDSDQDGECEGFIADGIDDFTGSCGALGCNGLGGCNVENGLDCSVNQACLSNICRQGLCGPQAGVGETCDENADCISEARCEVGLLCGIPGLVSTQTGLVTIEEGGASVTLGVGLQSQPSSDTILTLGASNLEFLVSPTSLTFDSDDWQNTKTVTLTAVNDVIDDGDISGAFLVSIFSTLDNGYNAIDGLSIPVQVNDNDVAGFILSPSTGAMQLNEGESSQGSLALATQPTANVVVSLSSSDGSEINVTETLTFTSSNWATPQSFDVSALTDSSVDGDQSVEIRIEVSASSDGVYSAIQPAILAVSVTDIDQAGLLISGADNLQVDEDGGFAEFQVTLSARPNRNVTVPLSLNPGGQASLSASSLTFTKNNWNTPQTVRVTGLDDFIDDDTVIFYVDVGPSSSSDNDFDDYTRQVLVSALDNDDAGIIRGNASSGVLSENSGAVTYQISLASQPVQSVTIPVVSQDASLSVSPASLSLDATNWNTGATLTVTGQDDAIAQGERDITLVWGPAESDDAKYDGLTLLATALTVTDDDVAGIEVGSDNLGVGENGSSVVGKFRLTSEPRESVTLELSGGVGEVSFSSSTLTFNASNWANYQFVTLTGVDDDVDDGLQTETILIQASSLDLAYQGVSQSFTVQNADNDTAGINVGDVSSALVSEDGGTSELSLTLSSRPLHDVTVSFVLDSTRGTLSNATQVFTPAQWDESRTLRFNSVDDALDNGNVTVTISASTTSLDPLYDGISVAERTLTVIDDDASGLVFASTTDFEVIEGDAQQASTNVKLATQPVDNVTLSFDVDVTEVAMISGDLTFTPLNWDQNQAIVFTSADDDIDDGTQATSVVVTSSSSDSDYNGLSQVLSCSTEDNDSAGVSVSITSSNVTEGGVSATASVVLDSEPVSTVTVSLGVDTSDLALNKTTLTFNSANWDSAQSFTVQANDDSIYEGAENGTLTVSTSASSDSLYSGLTTQTFDFSITDNESLPEISIADLSVSESDSSVLVSATVSVSPVSGDAITVGYSTQDDVALAGQDYQSAAGNVVIESGDSSATISLTVLGDNLVEADEDFALLLTSTSLGNFALGGDSALITILNDDASVSMGELSSSESVLSAALSSTTSLTCDFADADFTQVSDYRVSLAVRAPDNSTTYTLCDGVASSGACAAGGSPILSEPSSGQYRFTYPWDPAIGLTDGNYDLSCSVSDGANASSTDYASHSDEVRLDSTSPTVLEVREAAGGGGSYAEDDDLIVEIEFSEVVVIAGGVNLQLELDVGAGVGVQSATATYFGGSGTTVLQFIYEVEESNWADATDLAYSGQGSLTLGGSTTLSDSVGNNATLTLPVPGTAGSLSATSDIQLN